jgi:hypothetical protein
MSNSFQKVIVSSEDQQDPDLREAIKVALMFSDPDGRTTLPLLGRLQVDLDSAIKLTAEKRFELIKPEFGRFVRTNYKAGREVFFAHAVWAVAVLNDVKEADLWEYAERWINE